MLRRIDVKVPWRSLDTGFWSDELPLGCRTVVYGHNGSGKSTLSELLLSLAEGECVTDIIWEDENKHRSNIKAGSVCPSVSMAVFTRKWVETNLSAFLDGANASAIVTLGKEAIEAKEEEERLTEEIGKLRDDVKEADTQRNSASSKIDKLAHDLQDRIVSELKEFDYNYFTKNRFSVTRVKDDLRKYKGDFPDDNSHAEALKRLGESAPSPLPPVVPPPTEADNRLTHLSELLSETPTRVAIRALESNPEAQTWVEQGLQLHEGLDHCLFCSGTIDSTRREQLARHFDESWLQIRNKSKTLLGGVTSEKEALAAWYAALPAATQLASELQPAYEDAMMQAKVDVDKRVAVLEAIEKVLSDKTADPGTTPDAPDWSILGSTMSVTVLAQTVTEHNDKVSRHAQITETRKQTVLNHLVGKHSETFRKLEEQFKELAGQEDTARQALDRATRRLDQVRQSRFTTKAMADTLTRDLARVYGKDHLRVAVTPDGKSYACQRGNEPGTNLSDGERTTLSLLYFLRKLEDAQIPERDDVQRIVVIDDPSSSLDREAVFATHQWLLDTLKDFGQYIILTHDFSLLRLFIKSQKNAWGKSMSKISKGDTGEICFPKVSFLEMYAVEVDGERRSRVGKLPSVLLNNTSEYAYLFSMVMAGIADTDNYERLFLLPNAARRVLEVFASYKAPHLTNFLQQLKALVKTQPGEPYRDVYDFCNRFSHGEGSESIDVLDARTVHGQIRRCMEFMRAVDPEHFERMCKATGADPSILP
ncbi:AAA family ATPase [Bifidobacterium mongoliense]|jgi:wobble nucleotide-excising tRNase|uniref:AAA family ATPase n=1 Tax=Bifidobacterium mongoliense TaxID=518643 RepID=UPI0030EC8450